MDNKDLIVQLSQILDKIHQICESGTKKELSTEITYIFDEIQRRMRAPCVGPIGLVSVEEISQRPPEYYLDLVVKKIDKIPKEELFKEQGALLDIEIGKAHYLLGDLEGARDRIKSVVNTAEQLGLSDLKADALKRLGDIEYRKNNYLESEKYYLESLKLYKQSGNLEGQADIHNDLA